MKSAARCLLLLVVVGLAAAPAFAAELRVTGFIDNVFPRWDSNLSGVDNDPTRSDQAFFGRTRLRNFFNFIASDDLRGVFAIEIDQLYGAIPADHPRAGDCFDPQDCGFDNGIDNVVIEVKQMYVDFRVPQLPIGNRWRIGGLPFRTTPLHSLLLYDMDAGGGDVQFDFSDQVSALLYYVQLEEDLDRFRGSLKVGEDYLTGMTLMLKPASGLDFHVLGIYSHSHAPFGSSLTGGGGPFNGVTSDSLNVRTESRWYVGFDARYRLGNTTIEPGFIYLFGDREFSSATAAVTGRRETDYSAYQAFIRAQHTMGPWLFGVKGTYSSGDEADSDINNRGIGNRSDVKGFRYLGVDTSHFFGEWLEILGKSDVDSTGNRTFRRMGEVAKLERFGSMSVAGKVEYKATDNLVLLGGAGGLWTAEDTGCPAVVRVGSITGACGTAAINFTGNSSFVGWEVNTGFRYTILPGLTWTPLLAYADYGDALNINNRDARDAWSFINRMIYIF